MHNVKTSFDSFCICPVVSQLLVTERDIKYIWYVYMHV